MIHSPRKSLTTTGLVLMTIGAVDSIRNLPATALFGTGLIFFFLIAGLLFLLPAGLISAELASAWPKRGGIYVWVREAFGKKYGFLAIWFQWIENVIWYPTILSFLAATVAYVVSPSIATNKYYLAATILVIFWIVTYMNMRGIRVTALIASLCAVLGLIIPMTLIIGLGITWLALGKPIQIAFTASQLIPNLHDPQMLVSLTAVILCFCGIEIATVHAQDVRDPQRSFPKALVLSVVIILVTMIMGALTIAMVVPQNDISLVAGIMQAYSRFFSYFHMQWLLPLIAMFIVFGGIGGLSSWIVAPTKGLMVAAEDLGVPLLALENKHGSPSLLLIAQAVMVSLLTMLFIFMPSINSSYWILTALSAQLYMVMYILMFAGFLYLRTKHPEVVRAYRVPGGKLGAWLTAGAGIFAGLFTITIGFYPPAGMQISSTWHYEELLWSGFLLSFIVPLVFYRYSQRQNAYAPA